MSQGAPKTASSSPHISILGAGIIGLACAWALARHGARVSLHDVNEPGKGASWAAAGMLAPAFEAASDSESHARLFDLCCAGREAWPAWVKMLEACSGVSCHYSDAGSVAIAVTTAQSEYLQQVQRALHNHGVSYQPLSRKAAQALEPALTGDFLAAAFLPSDGQVDNRRIVTALIRIAEAQGFLVPEPASDADVLLDTRGWQTPGMQPVGGQMFSLERKADHPCQVVRAGAVYIVPQTDRTIIGASVQRGEAVSEVDDTRLQELAARAIRVCPSLEGAARIESWAGTRPATRDHAPVIGWTAPGRYVASGHYRNGILLAPLTAEIVATHIMTGVRSDLAAAFDPSRFALQT